MACPDGLDRITLTGISGYGYHGVLEHEKRDGQTFIADVTLGLDMAAAAASDDLADTVDYGALAEDIHAIITGDRADLLETVAHRMLESCLERGAVQWACVTVHKPGAPIAVPFENVSVTTERSKK